MMIRFAVVVLTLMIGLVFWSGGGAAATLDVVGGRLIGASNVDVLGETFDVQFREGSCAGVFSGCDNPASDFAFQDDQMAFDAAVALEEQVLIDGPLGSFDTVPGLTNGCDLFPATCFILVPFDVVDAGLSGLFMGSVAVRNQFSLFDNYQARLNLAVTRDSSDDDIQFSFVYAVFTPVPEPSAAILIGGGLIVLSSRTRRGAAKRRW